MAEDDRGNGWWGVPPNPAWKCPVCGVMSGIDDWREVEPACEDCGNHDGRECPECGEWFDHVWNDHLIEAQEGLC